MSENTTKEYQEMLDKIGDINAIEGFDPSVFLEEYSDLSTGEKCKRLPVVVRIAMFRMKYPIGKIAVSIVRNGEAFVATAKVYANYKDAEHEYLAEASASRAPIKDKPSVSAREWAQTAAIGVALRNAGFGLQFEVMKDDFTNLTSGEFETTDGQTKNLAGDGENGAHSTGTDKEDVQVELTPEEKYKQALTVACPIAKYNGKTLGDLLLIDPNALNWIANKYQGDENVKNAALAICEYAKSQNAA